MFEQTDINVAYGMFEDKFLSVLNRMVPLKKKQVRNNVTPWVTVVTKSLMAERDNARSVAVVSSWREDWCIYRGLRNRCSVEVEKDKKDFLKKKYNDLQNENYVKGLYKQLKKRLAGNKWGHPLP